MDNQRKALVMLTLLALCQLVFNGRKVDDSSAPAPVFLPSDRPVQLQVAGDVGRPGVYQLSANNMAESVILMSIPECQPDLDQAVRGSLLQLESGDRVTVVCNGDKDSGKIELGKMTPLGRITLKIPLDLNSANEEELELLPGIGPALAERIVEFRHKNGGFSSPKDLLQVKGIGEKKLNAVMEYLN